MDIEYFISSLDCERLENLLESAPLAVRAKCVSLQAKLSLATILSPDSMPDDVVSMNSVVDFEIAHSSDVFSMTLVYPREVTGTPTTLSVLAPIGTALLGSPCDVKVPYVPGNRGKSWVRALNIRYQPERNGDLHR